MATAKSKCLSAIFVFYKLDYMKVQIWSDVQCPFCYIGKRRFEEALSAFEHSNEIEIEWKSFLLNPTLKTDPNISVYQSLSESKGWQMITPNK